MEFGGRIFQQTIGIHMGTNCAPLLASVYVSQPEPAQSIRNKLLTGISTFRKFYGSHHDLVEPYTVVVSRIIPFS